MAEERLQQGVALLKEDVARIARELHAVGWVANHDGNVTVRLEDGRLLATPTAVSKRLIATASVLTLDAQGQKLEGPGRAFSELNLHLVAYAARADVGAVIHAHPPHATGLGIAGVAVEPTMIAEAVVSIGDVVPLVPYVAPGEKAAAAVRSALAEGHVLVMANHGVLAVGADLEQAFLRLELVEHLARIQLVARQAGSVRTIPVRDIEAMLAKRAKADLAPQYRTPSSVLDRKEPALDIESVVEEEIRRVLAK